MKSIKNNAQAKAMPHYEYQNEQRQERKADKERRRMRKIKRDVWNGQV